EPPHQAALRDQPQSKALLARRREALDHDPRLGARHAHDRQAGSPGGCRAAACSRREALTSCVRKHAMFVLAALLPACPSRPEAPRVPPAADVTVPLVGAVRGVAGDGTTLYSAVDVGKTTTVTAQRQAAALWHTTLPSTGGPIALAPRLVAVTLVANN